MGQLIIVSNRLPVTIHADGSATRTTGGLASALEGVESSDPQLWIGWPGTVEEEIADPAMARASLRESGVVPVMLTRAELEGFYDGYANGTLWPVLHYMVDRARFSNDWWRSYQEVNRKFADAILDEAADDDRVWIHDYHLFLVPSMLRQSGRRLRVGFFLHTPFCSSEIFRALPNRASILSGLLGADLIGFHTYGYLRHFRSALLRVLGRESEIEGIWQDGRPIRIGVYPIGHNHAGFDREMRRDDFPAILARHRRDLGGKRMILNVERLDYTKGLPEKLAAMRRFLEQNPEHRDDVLFVLIAVPSRQGVAEYDHLTEEVQREVGAINGEFGKVGHMPVQFLHRGFPMADLAALYALSEVCMVTPLRDGMNLVAKEFLDCQRPEFAPRPGVLVLSEFAGAANELSLAIQVNPHNVDEVADAIRRALGMPDDERRHRIDTMRANVHSQDSASWARRFLGDLERVSCEPVAPMLTDFKELALRLTAAAREGTLGLFLDYDGTLRDFTDVPDQAVPDPALVPLLESIARAPGVKLAVVSGRHPDFLGRHFSGRGITLVAEHGYRWLDHGEGEWLLLNPHVDTDWKAGIREHLEQAALLTPGTHVEEKQSALVWHYRKADPEFGKWRARSLLEELTSLAANLPVSVSHGHKIVEVSSLQVSKGAAVDFLLRDWKCHTALIAGDDQTDETMISLALEDIDFHTVKVGESPSRAAYRTDIAGLRSFLENLADLLASRP